MSKKEESTLITAANARDAITCISLLNENALTTITTHGPDDGIANADSRVGRMMHALVDKTLSSKLVSDHFKIRFPQTLDDAVSSPRYLVKVAQALLDTNEFLEPISMW